MNFNEDFEFYLNKKFEDLEVIAPHTIGEIVRHIDVNYIIPLKAECFKLQSDKNNAPVVSDELLLTLFSRIEQAFIAKTKNKPDAIEMGSSGVFYCSKSWSVSYGGTETISEMITAKDLTTGLDVLIKEREAKEEIERQQQAQRQKENNEKYEREQKAKREAEYLKLKKEFDK